jgi:hypothetical protein
MIFAVVHRTRNSLTALLPNRENFADCPEFLRFLGRRLEFIAFLSHRRRSGDGRRRNDVPERDDGGSDRLGRCGGLSQAGAMTSFTYRAELRHLSGWRTCGGLAQPAALTAAIDLDYCRNITPEG